MFISQFKKIAIGVAALFVTAAAGAQTYTGVQGPGWREIALPSGGHPTAQAAGSYTPRSSVVIQIDDVNGLANAPIPQAAKDDILADGFGTGPVYVDRDVVNSIADGSVGTKFAAYMQADSDSRYNSIEGTEQSSASRVAIQRVTPQGLICKGGWRTYTLKRTIPFNSVASSTNVAGGKLSFDGKAGGTADISVEIEYKKSVWSGCIPYTVRFKDAIAKGTLNLNNSRLALTASVSTTVAENSVRSMLYEKDGMVWIGPIPVVYDYGIPMDYGYKVILSAAATVDYSSQLSGVVTFNYVCHDGGCSGSSDTSTVSLSSANPNRSIQADATFDPFVKLGLRGRLYPWSDTSSLASATIGLKFSVPFMVYGYYGNACGDANNDGQNETVNTYFADLQARISLYTAWSVLNGEKTQYISFGGWAGRKINGALYKVLNSENNHTPLWNKRLYYADSGNPPSIFSPVLREQAGVASNGQYQYVLHTSMRPCVPFSGNYLVDVADAAGNVTTVTVPNKDATTDTAFYSASPTFPLHAVRVRDDDGRVFGNSGSPAPVLSAGGTPSNPNPPVNPPTPTIAAVISPNPINAQGDSNSGVSTYVTVAGSMTGGTAPYSYSWSLASASVSMTSGSNGQTASFAATWDPCGGGEPATGTVTLTVTDAARQTRSISAPITLLPVGNLSQGYCR